MPELLALLYSQHFVGACQISNAGFHGTDDGSIWKFIFFNLGSLSIVEWAFGGPTDAALHKT